MTSEQKIASWKYANKILSALGVAEENKVQKFTITFDYENPILMIELTCAVVENGEFIKVLKQGEIVLKPYVS